MEKAMAIREYVQQVRPFYEDLEPQVNKIQRIRLHESTGASTTFEGVIAACHNGSNNESKFKQEIMKDRYVKAFLGYVDKKWAVFGKTPEEQANIFWDFSIILYIFP